MIFACIAFSVDRISVEAWLSSAARFADPDQIRVLSYPCGGVTGANVLLGDRPPPYAAPHPNLDADYLKAQAYRLVGQDVLVMDLDAIIQAPVPPPVAGPFSPAYAYPKGRPSDLPYAIHGWPESYPYLTTCAMVYQTADCFDTFLSHWTAYDASVCPMGGYLRGEVATVQTANATRSSVLPEDYLGGTPAHRVLHGG